MEQFFNVFVKPLMYHPLPPKQCLLSMYQTLLAKIRQKLWTVQAVVGLAVGSFADRAIANGVPVGRLRKILQTVGGNAHQNGPPWKITEGKDFRSDFLSFFWGSLEEKVGLKTTKDTIVLGWLVDLVDWCM